MAYQRETGDYSTFVALLEQTLPLAESIEIRQRIEKNISIGRENLDSQTLEPAYARLKRIQDSQEHPKSKLKRVRREIMPLLEDLKQKHGATAQLVKQLSDSVAIVLREVSLAAWNKH